jgi:hypothetical protein
VCICSGFGLIWRCDVVYGCDDVVNGCDVVNIVIAYGFACLNECVGFGCVCGCIFGCVCGCMFE